MEVWDKMGVMGLSSPSVVATVVIVLGLVLNAAVVCHGGITSSFVRKVEKTIDMPLDSDVFRVPLGYNAPQQVCGFFFLHLLCFSLGFVN